MTQLKTWGGKEAEFEYSGSVKTGTVIRYGKHRVQETITAEEWEELLRKLRRLTVQLGISYRRATSGTVSDFLNRPGLIPYVSAILEAEGYIRRVPDRRGWVEFV